MNITDFFKNALESINSDSRFAETKNAFLVTFNSAMLGLIVALFNGDNSLSCYSVTMAIIFSAIVLLATICSLLSFFPLNPLRKIYNKKKIKKNDKTNLDDNPKFMFYEYISSNYDCSDGESYKKLGDKIARSINMTYECNGIDIQYLKQMIDLSCVAAFKFAIFRVSLCIEFVSIVFFVLFFVSII